MRSPNALRQRIFASTQLRTWYTVQCFQKERPYLFVARGVSFRAFAAGQSCFQARPFFRIGMIGIARRSMMAAWQPLPTGFCEAEIPRGARVVSTVGGRGFNLLVFEGLAE